MTLITVEAPQEAPQIISVAHEPINYAEASARYYQEAEDPDLNEHVRKAKVSTADYLAKRALEISGNTSDLGNRIKEYTGEKPATSR
ncbi:MAG: hypothetical protein JWO99_114 [Candidatus Saccharibacteria bacterium]|nr:hypothetical protein [Candidatus Saccharibacteria bacterium]